MSRRILVTCALLAASFPLRGVASQDATISIPAARVETLLRDSALKPVAAQGSRFQGDRTEHVLLAFNDSTAFEVKWAVAPKGGEAFNNQPRYEAAAYELQKLFLVDRDYVVPPTALRMIPQSVFAGSAGLKGEPTFDSAAFDDPASMVATPAAAAPAKSSRRVDESELNDIGPSSVLLFTLALRHLL